MSRDILVTSERVGDHCLREWHKRDKASEVVVFVEQRSRAVYDKSIKTRGAYGLERTGSRLCARS